jgi:hypothetical protein
MLMYEVDAVEDPAHIAASVATTERDLPRPIIVRPPYSPLIRFYLLTVGFMPVTLIAISCFGVPLKYLAAFLMLPGVIGVAVLAVLRPWVRRLVLVALVAGPISTLLYDLFRYCFSASGLINRDPIPHIGTALGIHGLAPAHAGWICGYLWRYLLNGTGLAVAFSALGLRGIKNGVAFGLFVVSGLMVVLLISPYGQQTLWQITPWTVIMGTGGHIIYGGVLGTFRADAAKRPWSLPYDKRRDPRPVTFLPEGWLLTTQAAPLAEHEAETLAEHEAEILAELAAAPRPTPKHAAPTSYVSL